MFKRSEWILLALITAAMFVGGFLYLNSILSPPPRLDLPPAEENRVVHPLGFSLICPENYKAKIGISDGFGTDYITMHPAWGRSRYTPSMFARHVASPPKEYETAPQGKFGAERVPVLTGPSGKYERWVALIHRSGRWYEVGVSLPRGTGGDEAMPPARWRRYLETFRIEESGDDDSGSATRPTTQASR